MMHEPVVTSALQTLQRAKHISLTTFRRSGEAVATPVWFAREADRLYVETGPNTGKVKRIRHTPRVSLAPCTFGGKLTGSTVTGTARIVEDPAERARAERLIAGKYGLVRRINYGVADVLRVFQRRPKGHFAYITITLVD
ncbi:MAG TPA: PPOX class F420-dependent oxidoreductase [Ktedonobacterales bacterium]